MWIITFSDAWIIMCLLICVALVFMPPCSGGNTAGRRRKPGSRGHTTNPNQGGDEK
ncbi:hypothetical protein [Gemmobacter lutimaris]|uniref:hypothetical protein n=1 Tax=Gemmobacter lutimaris TaxID=2306023 RepID=UPI00131466CF|nr:hypothetical protein [Gemmobacter lutimaris]